MWPRRRCRVVIGAASSISRLVVASARRTSSRRLRALRRRPRHGPHHHRVLVPVCRPRLHTLAPRPRVRCSIVSFARAPGLQPSEPTASAALLLGNETALCPRARQRFVADGCCARVLVVSDLSSTIKLVELAFCCDRGYVLSNGTDLIPTIADIPLQDFSEA